MGTITTTDGTEIFFKDWGAGPPVIFSHGWPLTASPGELQHFTPTIEGLYVPNIDDSLDEDGAKRAFWYAFRVLGQWWEDLPPY